MPVYSFECPVCGTRFDERLSFKDSNHAISCPKGHAGARRVFSVPSIVFKGSGFYVNDSRKGTSKESSSD